MNLKLKQVQKREIIAVCRGGFSNRIKCLLSSMKVSEDTGRILKVYWPKNPYCNESFEEIFDNDFIQISRDELESKLKRRLSVLNKFKTNKKFLIIEEASLMPFSDKNISLKYDKIPQDVIKDILFYLVKIKIKKELLDKSKSFSRGFDKNVVAIFIRRGDFLELKSGIGKVSCIKDFKMKVKKEIEKNSSMKFYLATEDNFLKEDFKILFGKRIITYHKKAFLREDPGAVKEAFIELLSLANCKSIIGNYGSTFTEMIWFFGGCRQKVDIVVNNQRLEEYFQNEKNNLMIRIKRIIYNILSLWRFRFVEDPKIK